jgi:hypothetical protein
MPKIHVVRHENADWRRALIIAAPTSTAKEPATKRLVMWINVIGAAGKIGGMRVRTILNHPRAMLAAVMDISVHVRQKRKPRSISSKVTLPAPGKRLIPTCIKDDPDNLVIWRQRSQILL